LYEGNAPFEQRRLNDANEITREGRNLSWDNDPDRDIDENGEQIKREKGDGYNLSNVDEEEAHKIAILEHKMSKKLNNLFKSGKNKLRNKNKFRDTVTFVVDSTKEYDMLEG